MPFHKGFDEPSDDVYCTREVVDVIFVKTLGGIEDEYQFRVAPAGKSVPGGCKVRGNVRSSSVHISSPESK